MVDAARFNQTIEDDRNLEDVYKRIFDILENHFSLKRFSMYEIDQVKHRTNLVFNKGLPEGASLWCDEEILLDNSVCRACRTAQIIDSALEDHICPAFAGNTLQSDTHLQHFCFPLIMDGKTGAVLQVLYARDEAKAVQASFRSIGTYLAEAAPVLESKRLNKVLHESALRDPMTGLFNRRFLEEFQPRLTSSIKRNNSTAALLMCDIDHFKETNDTYGHQVGDEVLISAARVMSGSVRDCDYIVRIGGEEFLILLMDTLEEKAAEIAERIRADLEAQKFASASGSFSKTISIGIAIFDGESPSLNESIHQADLALYQAKVSGRNQAVKYIKD